jgi:hypothetical protein
VSRPVQIACKLGHPFTPANVRYNGNGSQECVVCARRRDRNWKRRHRASQPIVDDKQGTVALVVWRPTPGRGDLVASWTFHRSYADAAAQAPDDGTAFTVVDIARKPWVRHLRIGKGVLMSAKELSRLKAAVAANTKAMRPHPGGLRGRVQDALADAELLEADPTSTPLARHHARRYADAMAAALEAETGAQ